MTALHGKPSGGLERLARAIGLSRISVDQCFLANICEDNAGYKELHDAINLAHERGAAFCPIHLEESIFESSLLPSELRAKIFALQNSLADGFSFHSFGQTLNYGTINLLLRLLFPPFREVSLAIKPGADFDALGAINRQAKVNYVDRMSRMPYPPASYREGMTAKELYNAIVAQRAGSMVRILESIEQRRTIVTGKPEWEFAEGIGEFLLKMNMADRDCGRLRELVINRKWEAIPQLYADSTLKTHLERGYLAAGRKAKANDYFDLTRIAVALYDADVILCDHPMAELLKQSKLLEIFSDVAVFSTRQVGEATAYIRGLADSGPAPRSNSTEHRT